VTFFLNVSNSNIQIFSEKNKISEKKPKKLKDSGIIWITWSMGTLGIMGVMGQLFGKIQKSLYLCTANRKRMVCRESAFSLYSDGVKLDTSPKYIKE
jgi:hypothetical protein